MAQDLTNLSTYRIVKTEVDFLQEGLIAGYELFPSNPRTDVLLAGTNLAFLLPQMAKDMIESETLEVSFVDAAMLAFEVADYDLAQTCVERELKALREDGVDPSMFLDLLKRTIERKKLGSAWEKLLD